MTRKRNPKNQRKTLPLAAKEKQALFVVSPTRADLENLRVRFGSQSAVAEILDVDRSQVTRWLQGDGTPDPENEEQIAALRYVLLRLSSIFPENVATDWLMGINAHLRDQRPVDLIKQGRVTDVLSAIEQTDTGAYA